MELKSVYSLTVIFVFSKISISSGVQIEKAIKKGNFQVIHQHPGINKCATAVLQKNDLVGGRVSNVTGVCEGLPFLWTVNETMQSGYAYVKKIYVQENYQPPMTDERLATWMIPGSLSTGAKVEVSLEGLNRGFHIHLVSSEEMRDYANRKGIEEIVRRSRHCIRILYAPDKQYFTEYVDGVKVNEETSRQIFTEERDDHIYKVLIQIDQADILKIYLRGEHVMTYSREGLDLKMLRQVVVDAPHGPYKPPVAIHRIEFTK